MWELLGQERRSDDLMVDGGTVNLYELEKRRMREDAAFFDRIIKFDEQGKVKVCVDTAEDRLELQRMARGNEYFEKDSSGSSVAKVSDDVSAAGSRGSGRMQYKFLRGRTS